MDSKFEEINDAYVKYQIEVNSSFSDCERFIYKMVDGLAVYLGCDRKDLVFGPTLRKFDESKSKVMDLMEATEMEGDGYWHFGLGIKLYGHSKGLFDRTQFAQFAVKKVDDEFIVNFEYDREFNIHEDNDYEFNVLYEFYFNQIKDYFKELFPNGENLGDNSEYYIH
ncbi:MAG: hypothetical protein ABSE83_10935 [Methanobacterium sp.]|jgi:hypothetical protein